MSIEWLIAIIVYFFVINCVGFFMMFSDKRRAERGAWRIKEASFFAVSAIGGGVGTWAGMYVFRHKTKHTSFVVGIPVCAVIGLALVAAAVYFLVF